MTCTRCQGLMLEETLVDMEASYNEMWSCTWRCVNCGHRPGVAMQQHRRAGVEQQVRRLTVAAVQEEPGLIYKPDSVEPLAA